MATTPFEKFVGDELPKRISTESDALTMEAGLVPVTLGVGLSVEFKSVADLALEGKSAYDVAVDDGFVGTPTEWLKTLEGKSAYQVWLGVPANAGKTEAQFLASLVGADGKDGPPGQAITVLETLSKDEFDAIVAAGESNNGDAYFVGEFMYVFNGDDWVRSPSLKGPDGTGLRLLGVWPDNVALPMDSNYVPGDTYAWKKSIWSLVTTPTRQWVDVGTPGPAGKSAYDIWLEAGNTGTQVQFLNSLKGTNGTNGIDGQPGKDGTNGTNGKSAYQIWLDNGNSGSQTVFIESLRGPRGIEGPVGPIGPDGKPAFAFVIAGNLADESLLPRPGDATKAYYINKELFVWIATDDDYLNMGKLNGDSAYQTWVEQPGNEGKSEAEFLASLKGRDGTDGTNGESAYQLWLKQSGNAGKTEVEFLASLKGTNGTNGKSAYTLWTEQPGNAGKTEEEFLASLNGTDGRNLQVNGVKPDAATIQAIVDPADQEAWVADDTGNLWIYNGTAWIDAGPFRGKDGTNGTNGTDGLSAYQVWLAQPGNEGKNEQEFIASITGKSAFQVWLGIAGNEGKNEQDFIASLKGKDGTNGTNGTDGADGESTYQLWLTKPGNAGKTEDEFLESLKGAAGKSAYQLWVAMPGNEGKSEAEYQLSLKGKDGTDGRNVQVKGSVADFASLPASPAQQDAYTVLDTLHLWMWINTAWADLGQFKGDQGEQGIEGPKGTSINILGEVETYADIPDPATLQPGDAWYVVEDHKLYVVNDALVYAPGINIEGPPGEVGPVGPQGETGTSIKIMGSFLTEEALKSAVPVGTAGEGYLIGDDLYLYGVNPTGGTTEWYNAGPVRGPQGEQGIQGKQGIRGIAGPNGERGSLWLTLLPGAEAPTEQYGREGDWAVSDVFNTFYKTAAGWQAMGHLVAGDVNSPADALGKCVREGKVWVKLPVDEVPTPVAATVYGRGFTNGTSGAISWLAIPKGIADLTVKDSKQMCRVFVVGEAAPKWVEIQFPASGIAEAPTTANKLWLRNGQAATWVEYTGISGPTVANKKYLRTSTDWVEFNSYDVAFADSAAATSAFDMSAVQVMLASAAVTTVNFTNPIVSGRATTVVVVKRGTGLPSIQIAGVAQTVKWSEDTVPTLLAGDNILTYLIYNKAGVYTVHGVHGSRYAT